MGSLSEFQHFDRDFLMWLGASSWHAVRRSRIAVQEPVERTYRGTATPSGTTARVAQV